MSKGYAFGFLIILLVLVLGFYVAFTGFMSSRDALRAQPTSSSAAQGAQVTRAPTKPAPTATATEVVVPTPMSGITATLTAVVSGPATEPPPQPTSPPADNPLPPVEDTDTPPPVVEVPIATPAPQYQFRLAGPPSSAPDYPNCCYLYGTVRDAAGNGLEGVQVQAFNEWNTLPPAATKGGGEAGQYNIPIGRDAVTWNLVILDAAGNRISTQVPIQFDGNVTNAYRIDWQRGY